MKFLLLILAAIEVSLCFDKLFEQIKKIHAHQDEELLKFKGDEYMIQSSKKQAKLMFEYMDANKDGFVSREEMREFGKVMVSNNTDQLDFWVDGNFRNDDDKDERLTFEEFYKPQMRKGSKTSEHEEL